MAKTKTAACNHCAGIRHSRISVRSHHTSARASDWLWFLAVLLAVVAIYPI